LVSVSAGIRITRIMAAIHIGTGIMVMGRGPTSGHHSIGIAVTGFTTRGTIDTIITGVGN
jgi:hypothetical protein